MKRKDITPKGLKFCVFPAKISYIYIYIIELYISHFINQIPCQLVSMRGAHRWRPVLFFILLAQPRSSWNLIQAVPTGYGGTPNLHPKCWSFCSRKTHGFVGETHHFRSCPRISLQPLGFCEVWPIFSRVLSLAWRFITSAKNAFRLLALLARVSKTWRMMQ